MTNGGEKGVAGKKKKKGCRLAQKSFSTPWLVILDFDFDEHDFHDLVKKQCEITKKTRRHLVDMARFG